MDIEDIEANVDITMTDGLIRLFAAAGCSPTECHACRKKIKAGNVFKLVPHNGTDEMCCHKCGEHQLVLRDKRLRRNSGSLYSANRPQFIGGYSRPSVAKAGANHE